MPEKRGQLGTGATREIETGGDSEILSWANGFKTSCPSVHCPSSPVHTDSYLLKTSVCLAEHLSKVRTRGPSECLTRGGAHLALSDILFTSCFVNRASAILTPIPARVH